MRFPSITVMLLAGAAGLIMMGAQPVATVPIPAESSVSLLRIRFPGFSVVPPAGPGWTAPKARSEGALDSGMQLSVAGGFLWRGLTRNPDPRDQMHLYVSRKQGLPRDQSLYAGVRALSIRTQEDASGDILAQWIQKSGTPEPGRQRLVSLQSSEVANLGAPCRRFDVIFEDNPRGSKGKPLTLTAHGYVCLHPDFPTFLIVAEYSQRYDGDPGAEPPVPEAEEFLRSLTFIPLGARVSTVPVGEGPRGIAVTGDTVWVALIHESRIARIDAKTGTVTEKISSGEHPNGLLAAFDSLWSANMGDGTVSRIDPETGKVVATISVGKEPYFLAAGAGSVWVSNYGGRSVSRIDPKTDRVVATIPVAQRPVGLAGSNDAIWVGHQNDGDVWRIDPRTNKVVNKVKAGPGTEYVLELGGEVWASNRIQANLARIDVPSDTIKNRIPVGEDPGGLALINGFVWVANWGEGTVSRIDPKSGGLLDEAIPVCDEPLYFAGNEVLWVSCEDGTVGRIELKSNLHSPAATNAALTDENALNRRSPIPGVDTTGSTGTRIRASSRPPSTEILLKARRQCMALHHTRDGYTFRADAQGLYWTTEIMWAISARSETVKWGPELRFRDGPGFLEQRGAPTLRTLPECESIGTDG